MWHRTGGSAERIVALSRERVPFTDEDRDLMLEAKAFRDSVAAGEVKAAPEEGNPTSNPPVKDDEIPF